MAGVKGNAEVGTAADLVDGIDGLVRRLEDVAGLRDQVAARRETDHAGEARGAGVVSRQDRDGRRAGDRIRSDVPASLGRELIC